MVAVAIMTDTITNTADTHTAAMMAESVPLPPAMGSSVVADTSVVCGSGTVVITCVQKVLTV